MLLGNIFTAFPSCTTQYLNDLDFDLSRPIKVKYDGTIRLPIYGFLLMFSSNIGPNQAPLRYTCIWIQNLGEFELDHSRPLKVKCDSAIGLPICGFLLMFNSNIWPNQAHLRDIRLQNLSDLDFDLSRSIKVKFDSAIELPIFYFLLIFNRHI